MGEWLCVVLVVSRFPCVRCLESHAAVYFALCCVDWCVRRRSSLLERGVAEPRPRLLTTTWSWLC